MTDEARAMTTWLEGVLAAPVGSILLDERRILR